ncbi:MAG: hypothetical protein IPO00_17815 [Betaproteobacteria bacterium]|nr:hypothetical protein [Betaproteobacteria bacterium]
MRNWRASAFAIDVASLGGMYAGRPCWLAPKPALACVTPASSLPARCGHCRFTNSGSRVAGGIGSRCPRRITNTGTVYAQGDLGFATAGDITNNGGLAAAAITLRLPPAAQPAGFWAMPLVFAAGLERRRQPGRSWQTDAQRQRTDRSPASGAGATSR